MAEDRDKTREELVEELRALRLRLAELERAGAADLGTARLATALARMPAILWTTDTELRFTSGRGGGLAALDLTPDEAVGVSIYEYFGTQDPLHLAIAAHRRALAGETVTYELSWHGRTYRSTVEPLYGELGELLGVAGFALDVTEWEQDREELRQSERRVKDALERSDLVAIVLDLEGRVTFCNDHLLRLTGYKRRETIGRNWFDQFLPDDIREEVRAGFLERIARGALPPFDENDIITRDGRRRLVAWNNLLLWDDSGRVLGSSSLGEDITELRRSDRVAGLAEAPFRELFLQNPHPMWVYEPETLRIVAANDAAVQAYGYPRDEFLRMTVGDLAAPGTLADSDAPPAWGAARLRRKDGSVIDVEIASQDMPFQGRPARLVQAVNVTQRHRAEGASDA